LFSDVLVVRPIDTLDLPELAPYRTLRRPVDHEQAGIFVAEGEKVVHRLLATSLEMLSVLVTPEWIEPLRPLLEDRVETVTAFVGAREILDRMVGFDLYQGVLAVAKIPAPKTLDQILAESASPRLFVALDGLNNSTNMGVVLRNCSAFGAQAVITGETCASPWLRRSVRNSMGAIFHLPAVPSSNLAADLAALARAGLKICAAHPRPDALSLYEADLTGDCCLVFGNEGEGLSRRALEACSEHVVIPMPSHVDSLNVGSASAAFLNEVARQRSTRRC
jgi:tRNA G18 (ribose-2'-O)-methylase SpoU